MRTVPFSTVLDGACDVAGLDRADLSSQQLGSLVRKINRRVARAWRYDRWPEILLVEQRLYRAAYDAATTYTTAVPTAAGAILADNDGTLLADNDGTHLVDNP